MDDSNSASPQTQEWRPAFTVARTLASKATEKGLEPLRNGSIFADVERSEAFQLIAFFTTVVHSCWLCIDVEWNHINLMQEDGGRPLQPTSTIVDNLFCTFFVLELIVRALAYSKAVFCFKDLHFLFDTGLIVLMLLEAWILPAMVNVITGNFATGGVMSRFSSLRILRVFRILRLLRTTHYFPELQTIVRAVTAAAKPVFFISLYLLLLTYAFAILFTGYIGRPNFDPNVGKGAPAAPALFSNVFRSMLTLFTSGVLLDNCSQTVLALQKESAACLALFSVFVMLSGMALLNMLVAVMCRVMEDSTKADAHTELQDRLLAALLDIDVPPDRLLHKEEWQQLRSRPDVLAALAGFDVAPCDVQERLDQCQEALFGERASRAACLGDRDSCTWRRTREHAGLCVDDFVEAVALLRWDLPASFHDTESMRILACRDEKLLHESLKGVEASLSRLLSAQCPTQSTDSARGEVAAEPSSSASASSLSSGRSGDLVPSGQCGEPCGAKSSRAGSSWLQGVPTEFLFLALKGRKAASLDPLIFLT